MATQDGGSGGGSGDRDRTVLGYNMCECGFEGISLKVAKRSCNQDSSAEVNQKDGGAAGNADDTVSIHVENETPTRGTEAAEKVGQNPYQITFTMWLETKMDVRQNMA